MTDVNHRRRNRKPVNQRYRPEEYHNGNAPIAGKTRSMGAVGKTDYLDKSMHGWGAEAPISGQRFRAFIPNDFTNGHRGMAKAVKGAKKFVRSRVRFHDNAATRSLAAGNETGDEADAHQHAACGLGLASGSEADVVLDLERDRQELDE